MYLQPVSFNRDFSQFRKMSFFAKNMGFLYMIFDIPVGTPSEIHHKTQWKLNTKFGAFIRRVTIKSLIGQGAQ